MPELNLQVLKSIPDDELPMLHFTLGQWIRNNFGLSHGENQKLLYSCAENSDTEHIYPEIGMAFIHPDDASMIIIQALWKRLQGSKLKKYDLPPLVVPVCKLVPTHQALATRDGNSASGTGGAKFNDLFGLTLL